VVAGSLLDHGWYMACLLPRAGHHPPRTRPLIYARFSRLISAALRIGLVALAGWALRRELGGVRAGDLFRHLGEYGWRHVALAAAGTVGSFLALGGIERHRLYLAPLLAAVVLAAVTELRPRRRKPRLTIVPGEMSARHDG
jgi:hypothetical protein